MLYFYSGKLGICYMHYHMDMITHDTALGEPVDGTGGSKLMTFR